MYEFEPVQTVRVKRNGKWYYFGTPEAAANKSAWWRVFDKYPHVTEFEDEYNYLVMPKDVPNNARILKTCCCVGASTYRTCPIHNHKTGYLARLHKRYARLMLAEMKRKIAEAGY